MIAAAVVEQTSLSHSESLSLLLGAEGFLFAAITLAITLASPDQMRQPMYPRLGAGALRIGAVVTLGLVSIGAAFSWAAIYTVGSYSGIEVAVEATALLIAVIGQPIITVLLTVAARRA